MRGFAGLTGEPLLKNKMNESKIKRLTYLLAGIEKGIEKDLEIVKTELLMAMMEEQSNLIETKYDRKHYHYFPLKK